MTQIKRPILAAVVRALLLAAGVAVVVLVIAYHDHIWKALVGFAGAASAVGWSIAQKVWANRDKWKAFWTVPPTHRPQAGRPAATPERSKMDLKTLLAGTLAAVDALPPEVKSAVAQALDGDIAAAQSVADTEVAAAAAALPPSLAALGPSLVALADQGIAAAQAEAQAKVDQWAAVKAAVGS